MYKKDPVLKKSLSPHSPHSIIPQLIKPRSVVLDIGCNAGFLGKELLKKDVVSDGIDINDDAILIAKKYYHHVFKRDLYKGKLSIPHKKYDYIVYADILEHLPRPDLVLADSKKYLKKEGLILISLPNIARIELRIKHLFGKFDYAPGIMGEDHLRFYTRESAINLVKISGFDVIKTIPTGLGHMLGLFPTLTAFQFVLVCRHAKDTKK